MKVYKKMFKYASEVMVYGWLAIILSALSTILTMVGYYYIFRFLREVAVNDNYRCAGYFAVNIVVYLTVSGLLYLVSALFSHKMAFRLETNLRKRGIDGLTDASFRFFDLNSSGYIRKTIDDNAAKTHMAVAHMLPDNSQAFLMPILALVLSFAVSWRVGTVILTLSVVSGLILKGMMGNGEFMKLYQISLDRLSSETVEYIRGMQVIKIFGTKLKSFKALHEAITDYSKYAYNYSISCKMPYVMYQLIFLGLIAIITIPLSFFLTQMSEPKTIAVELIMILFLSSIMMVAFMKVMWASMNLFNANYAVEKLEGLYDKMQEDKLSYGERSTFENFDIEFEHVDFSYGDKNVLENLSFSLKEKQTYALVGHSGSGKSTIAKLLSGFYKADGGFVKIGGHPLSDYTKESIIKNVSFVFQNSRLFKKTIYENVALADEKATEEEVMEAIRLAGCDEIIEKLPMREKTMIGSKGVYLSGGEIQRVAIARAILKKSPIVVMDEASAAIDADNEYKLQKAFKNLMENKTVIMIAHRMTSIQSVDEILVLEGGKITERGSHEMLLKKQGLYTKLYNLYQSANEWRVTDEKVL